MEFGEFLKDIRKKDKKMTMRELERRSGISQAYISQIENGKRQIPKPITLEKLAKGLNVPYEDLMIAAGYMEEPLSINDMMDNFKSKTNGKYHLNETYPFDLNNFFIDDDYKLETRQSTIKLIPKYKDQELTKEDLKKINKFVEAYLED